LYTEVQTVPIKAFQSPRREPANCIFKVRFFLLIAGVLYFCLPAFSDDAPPMKVSAGYALLQDETVENYAHGWVASVGGNFNPWFGLTGEVGGNAATRNAFATQTRLGTHSLFAGPQVNVRAGRYWSPFAHVLFGAVRSTASTDGLKASDYDFAVQPGMGLDLWVRDGVGIRVGVDYRNTPNQEYGGSSGFRFQIGFVADLW
jgi:hypothetical protein